jgi:hypothetical protein
MRRLLSQLSAPAILLYLYLVITQLIGGLYAARNAEPPGIYYLLYPIGFLWVIGWWLARDSRRRGVRWVFDMGLFLYVAWPFIMPYYLLKTRGVKGLLTILLFVAAYLGAYMAGVVLYALLTV